MRLTNHILDYIYLKTYKYSIQIGIEDDDIPHIIFSRKEVLSLKETEGTRNTRFYHGVWFEEINTIFINVKNIKDKARLRHVIIHELMHKRFPYLSHGKEYENKIKMIEKGKKFDKYNPKISKKKIDFVEYQVLKQLKQEII